MTRVLVTGGAGFIGSHVVDRLVSAGYDVTVLDSLDDQVHDGPPHYCNDAATYVWQDIRNRATLERLLDSADVVCHQASAVSVGQSMTEVERYVDVNSRGTAQLLDVLANGGVNLEKLVVASSMSLYGEGAYRCPDEDELRHPSHRGNEALRAGEWELRCGSCGVPLEPVPTPETTPLDCTNVYGITKRDQEELCLVVGGAYDVPTVALRYFNVYGPRQALDNPYTGVCAIFSSRIKNGNPPLVFEDGRQSRDFVHVRDVADANLAAIESDGADGQVVNVGTGRPRTVRDIAGTLIERYGADGALMPDVTGEFREGDIRHCYADTTRAEDTLGFTASVPFEEGMCDLVTWGERQEATDDFEAAYSELAESGLLDRASSTGGRET